MKMNYQIDEWIVEPTPAHKIKIKPDDFVCRSETVIEDINLTVETPPKKSLKAFDMVEIKKYRSYKIPKRLLGYWQFVKFNKDGSMRLRRYSDPKKP